MTSVFLVAGGVEMDVGSSSVGAVPVGLVPAFFLLPRTYVRGYPVPSLRDWGIVGPSAAEAGFFLAFCGTAKAVPFPSKVKGRVKIRVKGDGQECPSHTCH